MGQLMTIYDFVNQETGFQGYQRFLENRTYLNSLKRLNVDDVSYNLLEIRRSLPEILDNSKEEIRKKRLLFYQQKN
jgi:hypothetical protein